MAGQKRISVTYTPPPPPPPIADYHVAGTLTPNSTGDYFLFGTNDGNPSYKNVNGSYFIWFSTFTGNWYISTNIGQYINPRWRSQYGDIEGTYFPEGGAYENATVIAGPA